MGVVLGPQGRIWYANHTLNKVVKIEPTTVILSEYEIGLEESLIIFPNPATHCISIYRSSSSDEKIQFSISDISGKEIVQTTTLIKNIFDISYLSSGLYFVNIDDGKQQMIKKLIIE